MKTLHLAALLLAFVLRPDDLTGAWSGRLASPGMSGSVVLDLRQVGAGLQGDALFRSGPNEVRSPLKDIAWDGATLSFSATIEGAAVLFEGHVAGEAIEGRFQVREGGQQVDAGDWSAARGSAVAPETVPAACRLGDGETRSVVNAAATVLRQRYVDAARGEALAHTLESQLAAGAYDAIADARVLADVLGRDLFVTASDKHLKLSFSTVPLPPEAPDAPESPADRDALHAALRSGNFGFRKVEILDGNVGLLELSRFVRADLAGEAASMAMGFLQNCDALVIDLRTCGGGDPAMVAFLASWLFEGPATHVADMYRREDDLTVQWWTAPWVPNRRLAGVPVCVLTAARTSSAAEALAFHLQQLGRARVVGERSAGAAHPSQRLPLSDRFAIMLPTSRAFDPETGRDWEGTGVQPDLETPADDALRAAQVELLERLAAGPCEPERSRELREIAASVKAAH